MLLLQIHRPALLFYNESGAPRSALRPTPHGPTDRRANLFLLGGGNVLGPRIPFRNLQDAPPQEHSFCWLLRTLGNVLKAAVQ